MVSIRSNCRIVMIFAGLSIVPTITAQSSGGPSLFLSQQGIQQASLKAKEQPWAEKAQDRLLQEAAAFPESYEKKFGLSAPELPPEGGQWGHYYACPDTGTHLEFRPPNLHVCPDDGKIYKNRVFDQVVYSERAGALGRAAQTLALAFRITGNHHYAEEAASILKAYGARYLTYKLHTRMGTAAEARVFDQAGHELAPIQLVNAEASAGARVYEQTLEESIWLIEMAWAYDLLRDSDVLSAKDRKQIEDGLLRPAADVVSRAVAPTLNWQIWDDVALAAVGYTLGDKQMISRAIDGPDGVVPYLKKYVVDGFWIEGSWHYQFYTMAALADLAQMSLVHGRNLWQEEPQLRGLFASPIGVMFPNNELPAFNDSVSHNIQEEAYLHEAAYSATRDPVFAAILKCSPRDNVQAWLFGTVVLPNAGLSKPSSALFRDMGYGRLTAEGSDLTEVMKWGPHGGVHGHFDALGEVIFSQGRVMSVDPGTQYYGVSSHSTWDKQTVAHNTVVVDETSQAETNGKLLNWEVSPQFTTLEADAGTAYKNVTLTRRVVLTSHYILEITTAESTDGMEHTFDWVYHNFGRQQAGIPLAPWSGFSRTNGYQHLTENRSAMTEGAWQTDFHVDTSASAGVGNIRLLMAGEPGTRVIAGDGLGPDLRVPVPYVMARRKAKQTQFAVVIEPSRGAPSIKRLECSADGKYRIIAGSWVDVIAMGDHVSVSHTGTY